MTPFDTLARLRKRELDAESLALAEAEAALTRARETEAALRGKQRTEAETAATMPMFDASSFARRMSATLAAAGAATGTAEQAVASQRERTLAAYADFRVVETAIERHREEAAIEAARRAQAELDDIAGRRKSA